MFTIEQVIDKSIKLAIIVALAICFHILGRYLIRRIVKKYNRGSGDSSHLTTILSILNSVWKYVIMLFTLTAMLNVFGLGITANSLLAAAGVGGLALGIGAQDFIKDIVNGFTILLENHFSVGDFIQVGQYEGRVENITLRTTHLRGIKNELYLLPNNTISGVVNYTRFPPIILADVHLPDAKQAEKAYAALKKLCTTFDHPHAETKPELLGITDLPPIGVELTVAFHAKVGHKYDVEYAGKRAMANALNQAGVTFVCPVYPAEAAK